MSTLYSIGQMNQLGDALENAGFTTDDVTNLRSFPYLSKIKEVILGCSEIVSKKNIIDLDADIFIPPGWKVVEHQKCGQFKWDTSKVELYLCDKQKVGTINGTKLRKLLKDKPVLNACVLDYLLANPQLIPDSWKGKSVFFWGTIYCDSYDALYIRYLCWHDGRWYWCHYRLGSNFDDHDLAAISCK